MLTVLRRHADVAVERYGLGWRERKALRDLVRCRTAALGGHLEVCPGCGFQRPSYNSCRNRHCPGCQDKRRRDWAEAREVRVLPVPHFQVVFTLPGELRALAKAYPRVVFDLLFEAASHVLQTLARQRQKARFALTAVLHTWNREMAFHPHVHLIVSAGGLSLDGESWAPTRADYLFPERILNRMFRGRMLARLETARQRGLLGDARICRRGLRAKAWVVHVTPPGDRPVEHVVRYLARYVYGVAIHDARLLAVTDQAVTFRTRGASTATVPGAEFVRRFLLHVLPRGYRKVRHYGLLAPGLSDELEVARRLLTEAAEVTEPEEEALADEGAPETAVGALLAVCPACKGHRLELRALPPVPPSARGPPWW